jgi:hypothetical protein
MSNNLNIFKKRLFPWPAFSKLLILILDTLLSWPTTVLVLSKSPTIPAEYNE